MHWARVVMAQETKKLVHKLNINEMDAFEISGSYWGNLSRNWKTYTSSSYPQFDICNTDISTKYDIIFAEQIFEHLPYPYRAAKNVYRMLRPGGYFLPTLPFLIKIHKVPMDCSRWTPQGLKFFLSDCGFPEDKIEVYSWGNRDCAIANFDKWTEFDPKVHSLHDEPELPVVVWALAQKPPL